MNYLHFFLLVSAKYSTEKNVRTLTASWINWILIYGAHISHLSSQMAFGQGFTLLGTFWEDPFFYFRNNCVALNMVGSIKTWQVEFIKKLENHNLKPIHTVKVDCKSNISAWTHKMSHKLRIQLQKHFKCWWKALQGKWNLGSFTLKSMFAYNDI